MKYDVGSYGEYLIYLNLKHLEHQGCKFLFNIYVPMKGEDSTEIDVLMICSKGIFVFESKNYSGWIFGNEKQKNWTQMLFKGNRKVKIPFYNPMTQNKTHINCLKKNLKKDIPYWSIITFSDRCELKNINWESEDIFVIHRCELIKTIKEVCNNIKEPILSPEEIDEIYEKLYPYTQISEETKQKHIENIQKYKK